MEVAGRVPDKIGSAVGEQQIELVPGEPPVGKRDFELVVTSIITMRSVRVGDAHKDYCDVAYRARERIVRENVYRELIYLPVFVETVPHDLMPEWRHSSWRGSGADRAPDRQSTPDGAFQTRHRAVARPGAAQR